MTVTLSLIDIALVVSHGCLLFVVYKLWPSSNVEAEKAVDAKAKPIRDFLDDYNDMIKDARSKTMEQLAMLGGSYKNGNGEDIN